MLNVKKARNENQKRVANPKLKLLSKLINDDHWANSEGWSGPMPSESNEDSSKVQLEIEKNFVSRNLLENVIDRHIDGVAGREPLLMVKPDSEKSNEAEQEQAKEFKRAFASWWTNSGAWLEIREALKNAIWSGKGTIRLYIPQSKLQDVVGADGEVVQGIPAGLNLDQAMSYISVHAPSWDAAGIVRDIDQRVIGGYYRYQDEKNEERWELQGRKDGQTIVQPNSDEDAKTTYQTNQLLIFEIKRKPLISNSLISLSKFNNKVFTMGSRNIDLGGFVERTILNAQMPGEWIDDKSSPNGKRFKPAKMNLGSGVTNFLNGTAVFSRNEVTGQIEPTGNFASPSVVYKDPVSWQTFGDTSNAAREAIFDEAKQLHVLITGDALANGVSRVQAVQDFLTSLEPTRIALEQLLRWLQTTVIKLALDFTNQSQSWDGFSATAQARFSAIQPTPTEIDQAVKLRDKRLISLKTFYSRIGIEDAEAEITAIQSEAITQDAALKLTESLPTWLAMKALQKAFPELGIEDDDIQAQKDIDLASPVPPADFDDEPTE